MSATRQNRCARLATRALPAGDTRPHDQTQARQSQPPYQNASYIPGQKRSYMLHGGLFFFETAERRKDLVEQDQELMIGVPATRCFL